MEQSIIFQDWAVRATLEGRKTQTRRVMKSQPPNKTVNGTPYSGYQKTTLPVASGYDLTAKLDNPKYIGTCPYGEPGDMLWVREAVVLHPEVIYYRADRSDVIAPENEFWQDYNLRNKESGTVSSIHMPKWAARLWLLVTDIRVERVQDITFDGAMAEGIPQTAAEADDFGLFDISKHPSHEWDNNSTVENFADIWDKIDAKRGYNWDVNPWVWVIEFEVIDRGRGRCINAGNLKK